MYSFSGGHFRAIAFFNETFGVVLFLSDLPDSLAF